MAHTDPRGAHAQTKPKPAPQCARPAKAVPQPPLHPGPCRICVGGPLGPFHKTAQTCTKIAQGKHKKITENHNCFIGMSPAASECAHRMSYRHLILIRRGPPSCGVTLAIYAPNVAQNVHFRPFFYMSKPLPTEAMPLHDRATAPVIACRDTSKPLAVVSVRRLQAIVPDPAFPKEITKS